MTKKAILQVEQITKAFPGVKALDSVDFSLYPGEVHILAGENGAGKSTLTKCILGIYAPDAGRILYRGQEVHFENARQAIEQGIGAVYQELTMIPYLDAAQNIFFGKEPTIGKTPVIDSRRMYEEARRIMDQLHCSDIDLHAPVKELSVANQQMIEIAKALTLAPKVIIFDEPTTSLSSKEVDFLFRQIRILKERGIAILFISHRMHEIREIGDRITILRDGKLISCDEIHQITEEQIIRRMIGRELGDYTVTHGENRSSKPVLEVTDLCDSKGKVNHCSLELYEGEIVGLAGLMGSGRTELANLIYGIETFSSGKITFKNKQYKSTNPVTMVSEGMGLLPEDRKHTGLALYAPIHWNILASSLGRHFPHHFLTEKKSAAIADRFVERLKIDTPDSKRDVGDLSGGNQQKVVLAKWLSADTDVIIFDEPTKGIDVGAKQEIYGLLFLLASKGKSILVISSEMEELMRVCDRIYCLREGSVSGEVSREDFSEETIGRLILADTDKKEAGNDLHEKADNSTFDIRSLLKKLSLPPAFFMSFLLIFIFSLGVDHYLSFSNFANVLSQSAALLVLACGQALVILIQGTDLSLGSMVSFIGVLWIFLLNLNFSMSLSILICMACGACCGLLNGVIIAKGKLPVFIVTLGTQNIFKSLALLFCGSQTLYYKSPLFRFLAKGGFLGITYISWIAILCFIFTIFMVNRTRFGMRVRGIGGNPQGVHYSGAGIVSNQIKVFVYAGVMAAICALILCCRIESGNPNAGAGMEFNSIAAALLGGISMREGKGRVGGVFFGVFLILVLKSGLTQLGMSSTYQNATIGIVVLAAIIIDALLKKMENRRGGVLR